MEPLFESTTDPPSEKLVISPVAGDPWSDAKWAGYKWTVYRGVAYDLTSFIETHPAGNWLIRLGLGRDCTALFESYHLRPEVRSLLTVIQTDIPRLERCAQWL